MTVRLELDGDCAHLLIDRPERRNAIDLAMWEEAFILLRQVEANDRLRLLVLRSANGGTFSAGADLKQMREHRGDPEWAAANQAAINRVQSKLARARCATLAFVEGDCMGGGCGLALACDLRIATSAARFAITPARLGLVYPLHDVKLLTDLVGPGHARRLLFTGMAVDADEALRIGLVEMVAEDYVEVAEAIRAASPRSVQAMKRFVQRVLDGEGAEDRQSLDIFAQAFSGPDFAEGARAFAEKRPPKFSD
ncbi:enoyl-CoA hydratase/isomerase family protein [Altererythrobacter aurantiacus]|uniref:Enoyl-CoA hydratase/isomerase family protein n=1 Tax=Parapontixanthobacter aurantiacus TaxID=1463599 RepID=A0A844ZGR4_9SPHN|nr:enoyl-CoA hydratase-related protein [Parapontixanthobacter aurantiacus]MXO86734.1 enoyl-CoA hydratase/isomerase family protein [Parapontixanthobacter aurantiacus]